jgi:Ca2+:H+ antiporter
LLGHRMDLVIRSPLELAGLLGAALITVSVTRDGETNWLEGAMLLGVYLLLAIAFYFLPDKKAETSLISRPEIVAQTSRVSPEVRATVKSGCV